MKHKKRSPAFPLELNQSDYCLVDEKRKRKYLTELDAELNAPAKGLQQYVCEYCGSWHNGTASAVSKKPPFRRLSD